MPAVKKELPGREDLALALAAFRPTLAALPLPPLPGYLTPLPASAALPPAASLPAATAGYEALLAPSLRSPRAYLSLHEAAPYLHLPRDPLALERFSATAAAAPDFQPLLDNGEPCIEVECGANRALLYVRKLCQGSKGPSIRHRGEWLTPNEFQFVSGRETAKDWKRSIRHKGKSLKTLMSKGILQVHPPICDCPGCRISSPVNRGRLADKRTVALPTARVLKKELTTSFSASDGDSDGNGPAYGQRPGLKQEDTPHVRIMKRRVHTHWDVNISFRETSCSQDSDLPTLISSVHRSRHLVMPEHQSRCEFQRGGVEIGLGAAGDLLGKRPGRTPHVSGECPLEKKARSKPPQETLLLPELGPSMAPEDHYRRLVSALSEAGTFEDPQRLYHLGLPSHDLLRVRQEVAAASVRSPSGLEVHLPSSTAGQRRKQGLAQHREGTVPAGTPSFSERELSQPPPLLSPQNAPHIALGPHLRPPFLGVPSALCQTPGGDARPAAGAPAEAEPGPTGDVGRAAASEGAGELAPAAAAGARSHPAPRRRRRGVAAARGHAGTMGGLFMDGEEATAPEDLSKWTVDDVCSFVGGLSGCGEYAPVFREQGIDGETLPLLTEEHLLTTMGLKLGPALKIRAQVAKRLGRVFYMASFPVALPLQPPTLRAPERELTSGEQALSPALAPSPYGGGHPPAGRASPKQENGTVALLPGPADPSQPLC
ncbi:sterile alpha motif domain-containing protein 11 isoform X3 [Prionailurus viverrinus]|uniref:sterile alpha motif domain-containing protein 11 isoform X6 n=1 Tax=Prionailurus bengalensis TaxID=37029 RepID=UPI001CA7E9A0|nr:sterile alpha motif domain-containing protein 11 isoform X6 [Prionailurus bengalensis]XP_047726469.1 sterile alpha motif domain-containing protein 11 isoform X3 [Prionailurus viverrinus]